MRVILSVSNAGGGLEVLGVVVPCVYSKWSFQLQCCFDSGLCVDFLSNSCFVIISQVYTHFAKAASLLSLGWTLPLDCHGAEGAYQSRWLNTCSLTMMYLRAILAGARDMAQSMAVDRLYFRIEWRDSCVCACACVRGVCV